MQKRTTAHMPKPNVFEPGRSAMNRETAANPSNESPRKHAPFSLAAGFLLVLSLGLTACPVDAAWGRVSVGSSHPSQRFEEPAPVVPTGSFGTRPTIDYTFHDDASGATLTHSSQESSDSASESEDFVPPNIEAIELQSGEECLHEEGTCAACDELRNMYRTGKVDVLYCATIKIDSEAYSSDEFTLSVPLDTVADSCTHYHCDNGELSPGTKEKWVSGNSSYAQLKGSLQDLQSPFGVSFDTSESERTDSLTVHAYTPDDDYDDGDEDEDEDEEDSWLTNLLSLIGIVVLFVAIGYPIGLIQLKIEEWLK